MRMKHTPVALLLFYFVHALLASFLIRTIDAFVPVVHIRHYYSLRSALKPVYAHRRNKDKDDEEKRYQDALAHNKIRTDVNNFLTQRAIQSFIFLLEQCRDPHTVRWMEVS